MQRLLLVSANSRTPDTTHCSPPLGVLYLAAMVRRCTDVPVEVMDDWRPAGRATRLRERLRELRPTVVGLSAMTAAAQEMHRLAAVVKAVDESILVIVGGPHPTTWPEDCLADLHIDAVVRNEGEQALVDILEAREAGASLKEMPGLVLRAPAGGRLQSAPVTFATDLDALPRPAWDLVNLDFYFQRRPMSPVGPVRSLPIITSRGCPYRCVFCHPVLGKRFRARSAADVLDELDGLVGRYRLAAVEFFDDTFNYDRARAEAILRGIIERGWPRRLKLRFPNGLRIDRLDESLLDLLRAAGTDYVPLGLESGSTRIQKLIRKPIDLGRAAGIIAHADGIGLLTAGFFMVGFPTETEADLEATYDFAQRSRLHLADFHIAIPFPGTELFERFDPAAGAAPRYGDYVYQRSPFNLSEVPDDRFFALRRRAMFRFYASPARLWRLARRYPDPWQLPTYLPFMVRSLFNRARRSV